MVQAAKVWYGPCECGTDQGVVVFKARVFLVQLELLVYRYMWEQVLHHTDVWGLLEILDPGVAAGGSAGCRRLCRVQEAGQGAGLAGGLSQHFTDLRQVCGRLAETR